MNLSGINPELLAWASALPEGERVLAERCLASGARSVEAVLAMLLEMESKSWAENAWEHFDPTRLVMTASGPRRHDKQCEAIRLTLTKRIVILLWGNRVGKSQVGGFTTSRHVTGVYPAWWMGLRYDYPVKAYAVSTSRAKQLEVVQPLLVGQPDRWGDGCYIPKDRIAKIRMNRSAPDTLESVDVRWGPTGNEGMSTLVFRTYEQGRSAFESALLDWIWGDEEPPDDVFQEMKMRLVGNLYRRGGNMMLTFTPLRGLSQVCRLALYKDSSLSEGMKADDVGAVSASWEDNPYLPEEEVQRMIANTPERERKARQHGYPIVGEGAIFELAREDYACDWFRPPDEWGYGAGIDFGYDHPTGICWGTRDPTTDTTYIYQNWRRSAPELATIKQVLEQQGLNYAIFGDQSGKNRRLETNGKSLFDIFAEMGVYITPADRELEPAVLELQTGLRTGTLKIMKTCTELLEEMGLYHRKENHRITEEFDDLIDALRYFYRNRYSLSYRDGHRPPMSRLARRALQNRRPGKWKTR